MIKQLLVNCEKLQTRVALVENGRVEEYYIERNDAKRVVGSIYKGRIRNLEPSLQAAFVDIGLEKNAFLHYWDMIPATIDRLEDEESESADDLAEGASAADDEDDDEGDEADETPPPQRRERGRSQRGESGGQRPAPPAARPGAAATVTTTPTASATRPAAHLPAPVRPPAPVNPLATASPPTRVSLTDKLKRLFFAAPAATAPVTPPPRPTAPVGVPPPAAPGTAASPAADGNDERDSGRYRGRRRRGGDRQGNDRPSGDRAGNGDRPASAERASSGERQGGNGGSGEQRRRRGPRTVDLDEIPKRFTVNSDVVVQVSKGMIGEKGPRVTTNLSLPGRYVVLLPNSDHRGVSKRIEDRGERTRLRDILQRIPLPKNMGLICRTAGSGLTEEAIRLDVQLILEKWNESERLCQTRRAPVCTYQEPNLLERSIRDFLSEDVNEIVVDSKEAYEVVLSYITRLQQKEQPAVRLYDEPTPLFEKFRIDEQITQIFRRKVPLPSGAELCVDETEALIAIDVNSGRSRGGKDHPETILNTNMEAAAEVARQLRLRNIGGIVVVDFIDMRSRRDQLLVFRKMKEVLSRDRARTKLVPISRLGLLEMTRQREHESLQDAVFESCPYCQGRGIVKSSHSISVEIQRRLQEVLRRDRGRTPIRVTVSPRVLNRLRHDDAPILKSMEQEFGGDLSFRADPNLHQEEFHLIDTATGKDI